MGTDDRKGECKDCGATLRPGASFCGSCGAALKAERAGTPAPTAKEAPGAGKPKKKSKLRRGCCGCVFLVLLLAAGGVGVFAYCFWQDEDATLEWLETVLEKSGQLDRLFAELQRRVEEEVEAARPPEPYVVPAFESLYKATPYRPSLDLLATGEAGTTSPEALARALVLAQRQGSWAGFCELQHDLDGRLASAAVPEAVYREALLKAWTNERLATGNRVVLRVEYLDHVLLLQEVQLAGGELRRRFIETRRVDDAWLLSDDLPPGDPVLQHLLRSQAPH